MRRHNASGVYRRNRGLSAGLEGRFGGFVITGITPVTLIIAHFSRFVYFNSLLWRLAALGWWSLNCWVSWEIFTPIYGGQWFSEWAFDLRSSFAGVSREGRGGCAEVAKGA